MNRLKAPKTKEQQDFEKASKELRAKVAMEYNALLEKVLTEANGGVRPSFDEIRENATEEKTDHGSFILWKGSLIAFLGHPEVSPSDENGKLSVKMKFFKMI